MTGSEWNRDATILVVDDDARNVHLLERVLRRAGCQKLVSTVDSGQVLDLFRAHRPDLVVLDLHMPEPDGFQLLHRLRPEIPARSYLPILILSGESDLEVRMRALDAGATDFLTKPFDLSEATLRVLGLLATRRLFRALEEERLALEAELARYRAGEE